MSLYVQWINLIKEKAALEWLTERQRKAYDKIISQWQGVPFVNLCGPPGCGKSFIARLLEKEDNYLYTQNLSDAPEDTQNVLLDNATYTRLMRATAQFLKLGRVILITDHPVVDPMPRAEILLGEKDVRQFLHNLYVYCDISLVCTKPKGTDLSQIIRAEVIAKGGNYVT
jgi:hypothetical protein